MTKYKTLQLFLMLKIIKSLFLKNGRLTLINKNILGKWIKEVISTNKIRLLSPA
jgi:hypothetical protein